MNDCRQTRERLDGWLDDLLAPDARREVEEHLHGCAFCREVFEQQRGLAEDLLALAGVADRMASVPLVATASKSRWRSIVRIAAVIVLAAALGIVAIRLGADGGPTQIVQAPDDPQGEIGRAGMAEGGSRSADQERAEFRFSKDDTRLAVRLESDNPRIHIVWLYETTEPLAVPGDDGNDEVPG